MEQFTPLLANYFGDEWWATGGLSVFLARPVFDNEPARCMLEATENTIAIGWMENSDGDIVVNGTASLGNDPDSEINSRLQDNRKKPDLRMLAAVVIGKPSPACSVRISDEEIDERLPLIIEPMECYSSKNPFGHKVASIAPYFHAFRGVEAHIIPINGPYVGMFGAIEVQYLSGPVTANTDYACQGEVIALSASSKIEIVWHTATLREATSGREVARMTKMDRLLKSASPLWN